MYQESKYKCQILPLREFRPLQPRPDLTSGIPNVTKIKLLKIPFSLTPSTCVFRFVTARNFAPVPLNQEESIRRDASPSPLPCPLP